MMTIQQVFIDLLLKNPFFGYIAAGVSPVPSEKVKKMMASCSEGTKLYYNPQWFDSLTTEQKTGSVLHELLHLVLLHGLRQGNRQPALWAVACDMAVNEHIPKDQLPPASVTVPLIAGELKRKLERLKGAEYYYRELTKDGEPGFLAGAGGNQVLIMVESDRELESQTFTDEQMSDIDQNALKSRLAQTLDDAAGDGEVPSQLAEMTQDLYQDFRINWRKTLKRFLSGRGRIQKRKSWKKQSRRFDHYPGTKRSIGIMALAAVDESASIPDGLVNAFFRELKQIHSITGTDIKVTRFDTTCTDPVPLSQYVKTPGREKGGGTDFRPIFDMADRHRIPLVVVFTDGDGKAPEAANQKTLWVISKNGTRPADFGHYVTFNL